MTEHQTGEYYILLFEVELLNKHNNMEDSMNKYETIKNIMKSEKADENMKVYYIEMFLKGWYTEKDIEWLWR